MKRLRFMEKQTIRILRGREAGQRTTNECRHIKERFEDISQKYEFLLRLMKWKNNPRQVSRVNLSLRCISVLIIRTILVTLISLDSMAFAQQSENQEIEQNSEQKINAFQLLQLSELQTAAVL